jgi:hypothetical protein
MCFTGIGVVLDSKLRSASRYLDQIRSEIEALENLNATTNTTTRSNKKCDPPESFTQNNSYLQTFEKMFISGSKSQVGKSREDSTTVELHSFQSPASFVCKHCNSPGSFVDVSQKGPAHYVSCPRYSLRKMYDPSSLEEAAMSNCSHEETLKNLRDKLKSALDEERDATENNGVIVSKQHIKGPAYLSGLVSNGDQIISVDSTLIGTLDLNLNFSQSFDSAFCAGTDVALACKLLRGKEGTSVRLQVLTDLCRVLGKSADCHDGSCGVALTVKWLNSSSRDCRYFGGSSAESRPSQRASYL